MPQIAKATQRAMPHKITGAAKIELEPESSPAGPWEVSGEELAGAVTGDVLLDGSVAGESDGVAELEGIPAEASGGEETDGTSATAGASTGLLTGVTAGVAAVGGGVVGDATGGEDTLLDGLEAGETEDGGWTAGDFAGGVVAGGGEDPVGEIVGVCEGGDKVGDFAGDVLETVGECAGGMAEEGGFTGGGWVVDDFSEGAGALSAWMETEEVVKNRASTKSGKNLFIFGDFEDEWKRKMENWSDKDCVRGKVCLLRSWCLEFIEWEFLGAWET